MHSIGLAKTCRPVFNMSIYSLYSTFGVLQQWQEKSIRRGLLIFQLHKVRTRPFGYDIFLQQQVPLQHGEPIICLSSRQTCLCMTWTEQSDGPTECQKISRPHRKTKSSYIRYELCGQIDRRPIGRMKREDVKSLEHKFANMVNGKKRFIKKKSSQVYLNCTSMIEILIRFC